MSTFMPPWLPVAEFTPKINGVYNVTAGFEGEEYTSHGYWDGKEWHKVQACYMSPTKAFGWTVTHWMDRLASAEECKLQPMIY